MTEAEWLACEDSRFAVQAVRGRASARKWRLFCCALCRSIWDQIWDERGRAAVEVAERYADGEATIDDLRAAEKMRKDIWRDHAVAQRRGDFVRPTEWLGAIYHVVERVPHPANATAGAWPQRLDGETLEQWRIRRWSRDRALLREVVGNPFRPVVFAPEWSTDTAVTLARQMYESREFGAMPILADALQDAGCDSEEVLNHCRDTSLAHVRGCWVCDLVLGKE